MFNLGVLINPVAGVGGPAALKGSDGAAIQAAALAAGVVPLAVARMRTALSVLAPVVDVIRFKAWGGDMGAAALPSGVDATILGEPHSPSSAADTRAAATSLAASGIDVLLFAGGDGTARDIMDALGTRVPVLGVPAGVKMHSAVFAITPLDAGEVIIRLARGQLVALAEAEVRDIDEAQLRAGRIDSRHYGYLSVPQLGGYVQHTKQGGREDERLVHQDIASFLVEELAACTDTVVLGPGTTVAAIKAELGVEPTPLGFDVIRGGAVLARDADSRVLDSLIDEHTLIVLGITGNQGFLLGRGNQQLSREALGRIEKRNLRIVATRTKLESLHGAPIRVDTGDAGLDSRFYGVVPIIAGYDDILLHRVGRGP